ncbi:GumC family protein [Brucella sp. CMUL 010]|uniref:GumC family protein n=1 Tax=Brucella sp. CMUL 010 TaxID=1906855 RepID=UPI0008778CA9|nr:GumC family protein [Brucella sp. CMUL 010]
MDGEDKRKSGSEGKPLLAFSDAPVSDSKKSRSTEDQASPTPPWTPPASPRERAQYYRSHQSASSALTDEEIAGLREIGRDAASSEDKASPSDKEQPASDADENWPRRSNAAQDAEWKPLIDPRIAIDVIRGSRRLLLPTTIFGGIVATLYALSLPQTYIASTDILVDPRNIKVVGMELTPGQLPTDASLAVAESQARMIDSSSVLLKVINKAHLIQDPEFNGTLVPTGIVGFFAQLKDLIGKKEQSDSQTMETRVLDNLRKSLTIHRDAKTFIYSISVTTREANKSASLANEISSVFQDELASLQSDAARRTSEELFQRLADLRASVEGAEKAVADFRATHDLIDVDGRLISNNELGRLNEQLTNQRAETVRLQARINVLKDTTPDSVVAGTLPEDLRSNTLTALRAQYAQARQAANGMATRLGPRHPQLIQLNSQANAVLNDISAELQRVRSSLQVEVQRSQQQETALSARLAQLKARQANDAKDLVKLRELEREAAARRSIYEAFLLRSRETSEQEGLNTVNIRVLSAARPPLEPAGSTRKLIVIAGLIAGFLAGLAITIIRNFGRLLRL